MVYALMREFVGQLEATVSRRLQRGVLKRRINKPKLDTTVLSNRSTPMTIHRGPALPPLIVTSRNTMKQTLQHAVKAAAAMASPASQASSGSVNKRKLLSPLFKSIGLNVSNYSLIPNSFLKDKGNGTSANNSMIKTEPGGTGLGTRYDGSRNSCSQE